jgi:hypothetical protein
MVKFKILILAALTTVFLVSAPAFAQLQRQIEWPEKSKFNSKTDTTPDNHIIDRINEIEIEAILVNGREIIVGEPFSADTDWLKAISFRVKNVSDKPIRRIQITLVLPEIPEIKGRPQIQYLCLSCKGDGRDPLAPGAETELRMPEGGLYAWVKDRVNETTDFTQITRARIYSAWVTMDDGLVLWSDCIKTSNVRNACPYRTP